MAVFTVLRHVGTAQLADLLDIRLPCIDEVDVFVREFLQQHTVLMPIPPAPITAYFMFRAPLS